MSKSLNRAFIKAYSKDAGAKSAPTVDTSSGAVSGDADALVVYYDTATIAIPKPHFLDRGQTSASSVGSTTGNPRERTPAAQPTPMANPQEQADALRRSIAEQMLQAGGWEVQLNTFFGGSYELPTQSSHQAATRIADRLTPAAAESATPTAPSHALQNDWAASSPATGETVERVVSASTTAPQPAEKRPSPPDLVPPQAPAIQSNPAPAIQSNPAPAIQSNPAPASGTTLQSTSANPGEANWQMDPHTSDEDPQVQNRDIFRLDRPSYSELSSEDDSGSQSSMLELPTLDRSATAAASRIPQELKAKGSGRGKRNLAVDTRNVEQNLREAKLRIFNPVWEVDSLQWPDICYELLEHSSSDMDRVAANLIAACEEGLQVLAITSPHSGDGRTTVACCLSMLAGSRGLKVAVLDGDIENPSLSLQTNLDVEQDWKSAIINQMPLEEVAVHSIDDQVTVVPLCQPISHSEIAADVGRIASMIQELADSFDLVIVDMGHMASPRNLVTSMAEHGIVSAVVAVVDRRNSSQQHIDSCVRKIRLSGVSSVGLVENFAA